MNKQSNDKLLLKEIIVILVIKVIVLFVIWHSFFDEPTSIDSPKTVADSVLGHILEQGEPL
ncbi:MAG: hypothetical protein IBX57_02405 [Gammaproteobacteria bacterium]|nr:hypothetical protein [Gammaproteobacteria bacterium]